MAREARALPERETADWTAEQWAEAASNFAAFLHVLKDWDNTALMQRVKHLLESPTSDCSLKAP